jgi:hypothetical protein
MSRAQRANQVTTHPHNSMKLRSTTKRASRTRGQGHGPGDGAGEGAGPKRQGAALQDGLIKDLQISCRRSSTKSANDIEVEKLGPVLRAAGRSEGATVGDISDAVYAELAAKRPTAPWARKFASLPTSALPVVAGERALRLSMPGAQRPFKQLATFLQPHLHPGTQSLCAGMQAC